MDAVLVGLLAGMVVPYFAARALVRRWPQWFARIVTFLACAALGIAVGVALSFAGSYVISEFRTESWNPAAWVFAVWRAAIPMSLLSSAVGSFRR